MDNLLSILVPVYGVEMYIERCAHSLFNQTLKNIEYVFVDDCTKDDSIDILKNVLKQYPERISAVKIIKHKLNSGVSAARSTALKESTGKYILFVDSDDYIELNMAELMVNEAVEKSADIVFCSIINEYLNISQTIIKHIYSESKIQIINNSFSQPSLCNKLFRKELITKNQLDFHKGINYGEDLSFTPCLIYCANKFAFVDKPLYHYVQYNTNSYTSEFSDSHLKQTKEVIAVIENFFNKKADFSEYSDSILLLKLIRKAKIIRSGKINKGIIKLYPETNAKINKYNIDFKTKLILFLARYNQLFLLKLFVSLLHLSSKRVS